MLSALFGTARFLRRVPPLPGLVLLPAVWLTSVPLLLAVLLTAVPVLHAQIGAALGAPVRPGPDAPPAVRGEYVFHLTGGCGCHTDFKHKGAFLAGGRAIKTPFGTLFGTNLTPDPDTGLGTWSEQDFIRAMTQGVRKDGQDLFPVFPYTSFTRMSRQDLTDLWAYLKTVKPVRQENRQHEMLPPFGIRLGLGPWKAMNFTPGPLPSDPAASEQVNRGAYIVQALAHCAECHTPRNFTGALKRDLAFAGSLDGPEGELAPNITPDGKTGIGDWSAKDITYLLETGSKPDGDTVEGLMAEAIENGYHAASEQDLAAIAAYLKTLKPIVNKVGKKKK
jgi:mono/diheme cytochrome c family protein